MYSNFQSGILQPIPALSCHLFFNIQGINSNNSAISKDQLNSTLMALAKITDGEQLVIGLGNLLLQRYTGSAATLVPDFPDILLQNKPLPNTPFALWCWIRASNHSDIFDTQQQLITLLSSVFTLAKTVQCFKYQSGKDLTGYEDGTENPTDDDAVSTAFISNDSPVGLAGSSIVALQQWQHNWQKFEALPAIKQDHAMGRRKSDNEELEDAPASAHVKRTAQESFSPEAFVLRRSMPWTEGDASGLMFSAFAQNTYAFEVQLRRMTGQEDGICDALFEFTTPLTGCYFWCPPMYLNRLDLRLLQQ